MEFVSGSQFEFNDAVFLSDLMLQQAQKFGNHTALVDGESGRTYTYEQLAHYVDNCAAGLGQLGVQRGDRVCVLLPNCIDFPLAFLAVIRLGAVFVPVTPACTKYELADIVTECQPRIIISDAGHVAVVDSVVASSNDVQVIILGTSSGYTSFETLLQPSMSDDSKQKIISPPSSSSSSAAAAAAEAADPRELIATIYYSSGTTGKPKGCVHTHSQLVSCVYILNATFGRLLGGDADDGNLRATPSDDVTVAVLPMYHSFGLVIYVLYALTAGLRIVVMSKFDPVNYIQLVHSYKATLLYVVPPLVARVLSVMEVDQLRHCLSTVRNVYSSAVALSDAMIEQILDVMPGVRISQGYGMTETALIASCDDDSYKLKSCGRPVSNVTFKTVDANSGRILAPNEDGELLVKSPAQFKCYWNNPDATRNALDEDGWYKTGDYGHFDEKGNLYLVDRVKDILKYKGLQVSPAELESVLMQHPDVMDAAVIGVADDVAGDLPRAIVVPRRSDVSPQHIVQFVHERVSAYKHLRGGIEFVEQLPRQTSGKLIRRKLAEKRSVNASPIGNVGSDAAP